MRFYRPRSRLNISVAAPFITLDKSCNVDQNKFAANAEPLIAIDRLLTSYAEQSAGAYVTGVINPNDNSSEKTATEAKIDAARSEESNEMLQARFQDQFFTLIGTGQQRALAPENLQAALEIYRTILGNPRSDRKAIYEGNSRADGPLLRKIVQLFRVWPGGFDANDAEKVSEVMDSIASFAESPATIRAHVLESIHREGVAQLLTQFAGDPDFNQQRMKEIVAIERVGPVLAKEILVPQPDETVVAEAARAQMEETTTMRTLQQPVPVSPRDNDLVHAKWLRQFLTERGAAISGNLGAASESLPWLMLNAQHMGEHLAALDAKGQGTNDEARELTKFHKAFSAQLEEVGQVIAHAQAAEAAVTEHLRSGGAEPETEGQPAQTAAPAAEIPPPPAVSPAGEVAAPPAV